MKKLIEDIFEINRRVCFDLWNIADINGDPKGLSPRLILPKKRNEGIRVSEQESRVIYCGILNGLSYYYSIETPTEKTYSFKPKHEEHEGRSASSDLSIYLLRDGTLQKSDEKFQKMANVEFKAHNPGVAHIQKDFEKFVREGIVGNWFHTLQNVDSGTIPSLFGKMKDSFGQVHCKKIKVDTKQSFVFCFCVLKKLWACIKHFEYDPAKNDFKDYVAEFFQPEFSVRSGMIETNALKGWQIVRGQS